MKLTLIRTDRETGKESFSTLEAENLIVKIKKENKAAHVSALRHLIPILQGTNNHYQNIDRLPRIYPAVEYARTKDGEHRVKIYNGLVQIEVNHLTGSTEVEQIKQQVSLLPQTFAAFCGSSGRSVKIWVLFALPDGSLPKRESEMALISCPRLPPRSELLPTSVALLHHPEGTVAQPKLPHDAGRATLLQPCRHPILPGTALCHTRRNHLQGTKASGSQSPIAYAARL